MDFSAGLERSRFLQSRPFYLNYQRQFCIKRRTAVKALLRGCRLSTLLHFTLLALARVYLHAAGALWPTTGWWHAVFVTPWTNLKPWAVVTCAKLAVKSLKGPLDFHRQKVLPSTFCPPFINTFLKASGFISRTRLECQVNVRAHSQRSEYKGCYYRQSEEMCSSYSKTFCQAERSTGGKEPATRKTLMTCYRATADIYQSDAGESVHHMIFFFPLHQNTQCIEVLEADVTCWQKKNTLFPVLLAGRCINTVCWDVLFHTRPRDKLLIDGYWN